MEWYFFIVAGFILCFIVCVVRKIIYANITTPTIEYFEINRHRYQDITYINNETNKIEVSKRNLTLIRKDVWWDNFRRG